jgi:hypothetical protein
LGSRRDGQRDYFKDLGESEAGAEVSEGFSGGGYLDIEGAKRTPRCDAV